MYSMSVVSASVCDIFLLHSLWCWFLHERHEPQEQERQEQHAQQILPVVWWRQLWGVLVCALATAAIFLTCKATSGQRRAARAAASRRKTVRQRSDAGSTRVVASEAIETARSAPGWDNRQTTEQWWSQGSASGAQSRRSASGSRTDSLQPEQQQRLSQQQQLEQRTPRLSPRDAAAARVSRVTPSAGAGGSSASSTPRGRLSTQATPRIRNLLSSEDLADSKPSRTSSSRSLPLRRPSITNLLPTAAQG